MPPTPTLVLVLLLALPGLTTAEAAESAHPPRPAALEQRIGQATEAHRARVWHGALAGAGLGMIALALWAGPFASRRD
jgi:hypothetical protein